MKKIFFAVMASLALCVTACAPNPQKIVEKIVNGEELSADDYSTAFDYTNDVLNVINDSIAQHKGDFEGIVRALKYINDEYPESNVIVEKLLKMDPSDLDEKNRKQYEELIKNIEAMTQSIAEETPTIRREFANEEPALEKEMEMAGADSLSGENATVRKLTPADVDSKPESTVKETK